MVSTPGWYRRNCAFPLRPRADHGRDRRSLRRALRGESFQRHHESDYREGRRELAEWSSRPLDPHYPVFFVDAIVVKVLDRQVRNTPFEVVMGVTTNGERDILGIWAGDGGERARFWLPVFSELKNGGVEDVLIAVCDGLKGFLEAITTTWQQTVVQQCVVHLIRDPFRYAGRQHRDGIVNLGISLGGVRTLPRIRRRDRLCHLHDKRD